MFHEPLETGLQALLPADGILREASHYALFPGGKRLRPKLLLASALSCGAEIAQAIDPACALELVHTYSLIHDDLPCMDDDAMRRGKPSLHKAFPEGIALLTGDLLLTLAFETLANAPLLGEKTKIDLISLVAKAAGSCGMVGGQAIDLLGASDEKGVIAMHRGKTAALFAAALQCGARIAECDKEIVALFGEIGEKIGLAFQMEDDLADGEGALLILGREEVEAKKVGWQQDGFKLLSQVPFDTTLVKNLLQGLFVTRKKNPAKSASRTQRSGQSAEN
ncbi:MAG: polyprenyl synthetase family protein [Verrucomicrobiota bacterium]|nr:polyprenyl synthetase family protein [Verrucomicrobiota bacterium]